MYWGEIIDQTTNLFFWVEKRLNKEEKRAKGKTQTKRTQGIKQLTSLNSF